MRASLVILKPCPLSDMMLGFGPPCKCGIDELLGSLPACPPENWSPVERGGRDVAEVFRAEFGGARTPGEAWCNLQLFGDTEERILRFGIGIDRKPFVEADGVEMPESHLSHRLRRVSGALSITLHVKFREPGELVNYRLELRLTPRDLPTQFADRPTHAIVTDTSEWPGNDIPQPAPRLNQSDLLF